MAFASAFATTQIQLRLVFAPTPARVMLTCSVTHILRSMYDHRRFYGFAVHGGSASIFRQIKGDVEILIGKNPRNSRSLLLDRQKPFAWLRIVRDATSKSSRENINVNSINNRVFVLHVILLLLSQLDVKWSVQSLQQVRCNNSWILWNPTQAFPVTFYSSHAWTHPIIRVLSSPYLLVSKFEIKDGLLFRLSF